MPKKFSNLLRLSVPPMPTSFEIFPDSNPPKHAMYDYQQPDAKGHFGIYGGSFVSETLTHAINELKATYAKYQHDPEFIAEFKSELAHFVGRPSPVYHAARMSR